MCYEETNEMRDEAEYLVSHCGFSWYDARRLVWAQHLES